MADYERELDGDLGGDATPYMSDDDEFERDGTHTILGDENENLARRNDLARQLEDLVAAALDWSEISDDEDAREIYEDLVDLYERVSAPLEDTDDEVV
ncbi:hypothetical protein [Truepera radiovictrix]|uniref:Uncharacterized protein n=1 Tax=Truepera radiovictrix (strain DSM 17093 / CIP 108686 / LMG 22925 / RQ-24) TaxID=649638 RepID=D7CWR8_TRURR|nr:hypothetical protein [Truepera radiovictrix]ADI13159.1 conserved hypothetical protein [Truepera radiovictrix DSM 17093]WMT58272.1 hypothetical protein RCV51_04845 [Truepera radiovictrix]